MNQIIVNLFYDPETKELEIAISRLGPDKTVNLKQMLEVLHAAEGQYIQALQEPPQPPEPAEPPEAEDDTAKD